MTRGKKYHPKFVYKWVLCYDKSSILYESYMQVDDLKKRVDKDRPISYMSRLCVLAHLFIHTEIGLFME